MQEDSAYCESCGSCGEEFCCSPTLCFGGPNCGYPEYQEILHDAYRKLEKLRQLAGKNSDLLNTILKYDHTILDYWNE